MQISRDGCERYFGSCWWKVEGVDTLTFYFVKDRADFVLAQDYADFTDYLDFYFFDFFWIV